MRVNWQRYLHFLSVWLLSLLGYLGLLYLNNPEDLRLLGTSSIIGLSALGLWRWSWVVVQLVRARYYLHWIFPRWRRAANGVPVEELPPVCCLVPTYHEKPWITERVFRALAQEAITLPQPLTLLVTSGSPAENTAIRNLLETLDPKGQHIRLIQEVQTGEGKRKAMAQGLRTLASLDLPTNTVVALMDGDSEITPGTLRQCLPFFQLFPRVGALTTDELPVVKGSYLFSEWFHLRMAQRHHQMASIGLSQKVLCLTGRFSLFRSEAALAPSFADQLESDTLEDWLWGKFKFLSGDDKSTWFWLLSRGYDMLYIPDVVVYSIETISGSVLKRAYQNMRRWYGNMLRNSSRAIALGPQRMGWFTWYCLLDQRISYWTSLLTPGLLLLALLQADWLIFGLILSWVCFSRPLVMMVIFWQRSSQLKLIHALLLPLSQWSGSLVKVWTQMNLAQQTWSNRGSQSISAAGTGWVKLSKLSTSRFLYSCQLFSLGVVLFWMAGLISPITSLTQLSWRQTHPPTNHNLTAVQVIQAADYGVQGSDGQADDDQLQHLIDTHPDKTPLVLQLPLGEIELDKPLQIHRSQLVLQGQGPHRTILKALFSDRTSDLTNEAVLQVTPAPDAHPSTITEVTLKDFSIESPGLSSLRLHQTQQVTLQRLDLRQSAAPTIVRHNALAPTLEYVAEPKSTELAVHSP